MRYDSVGPFWNFLNYVFRIDILITEITGTGLATAIIFLVFTLLYWVIALLLTFWYRASISHSSAQQGNYKSRFNTIRNIFDIFSQILYRICAIPILFFCGSRIACHQDNSWCDDVTIPEISISWILLFVYAVSRYYYLMFSLEYSWTHGCYLSARNSVLIRQKTFGLTILAILIGFLPYDDNEDAYILILIVFGLLQMGKWMNAMPYHRI